MEQNNTGGKDYGLSIEGHYVEPRGSAQLPVINPATGETWATITDASAQDVEQAVDAARGCFESTWSRTSPGTRARLLSRLAECIERRSAELAEIEVPAVGDPFSVKL
jgi:acyl-CoA reductase-like NAD-dependent aldehyde dehydrogenase